MTEFRIGQRVRYIYQPNAPHVDWVHPGTIGTINDIYNLARLEDNPYPIYVDFENGLSTSFRYDELELVHPIARTHAVRP